MRKCGGSDLLKTGRFLCDFFGLQLHALEPFKVWPKFTCAQIRWLSDIKSVSQIVVLLAYVMPLPYYSCWMLRPEAVQVCILWESCESVLY